MPNKEVFLDIYEKVYKSPELIIRGKKVRELQNASFTINPIYPVTSFLSRNMNFNYAKKEVLWYLRGDRYDLSICNVAGAWNDIIQKDGGINSNYGQTIFNGPINYYWVIEELLRDKYSRRAVIILGESDKLNNENTDHRCTMYICYSIRNNKLNQSVHMRSNDLIFGVTNDVFFFGILHQMIYTMLKDSYTDLELGDYIHNANSLHVYEQHYNMLENILKHKDWFNIYFPKFSSPSEVMSLVNIYCFEDKLTDTLKSEYKFISWLRSSNV